MDATKWLLIAIIANFIFRKLIFIVFSKKKLVVLPDSQSGLELLHLFVLDILGRDTPAAKIFMTKSSIS
jgi:hypothetical protein